MVDVKQVIIEHVVISSDQPYEKVLEGLKARMGSADDWLEIGRQMQSLAVSGASWEQVSAEIERHIGTSGFTIFNTAEHTPLLVLSGKTSRAIQYAAGNPLLAIKMSRVLPETALYAPLRFVVYEDEAGQTFVAYDRFVSLLAQYERAEITQVAQDVEQKLENLLHEVTQ